MNRMLTMRGGKICLFGAHPLLPVFLLLATLQHATTCLCGPHGALPFQGDCWSDNSKHSFSGFLCLFFYYFLLFRTVIFISHLYTFSGGDRCLQAVGFWRWRSEVFRPLWFRVWSSTCHTRLLLGDWETLARMFPKLRGRTAQSTVLHPQQRCWSSLFRFVKSSKILEVGVWA